MVNKNKDNRKYSSHRHIYRKKKNPKKKIQSTRHVEKRTEQDQGVESLSVSIEGSRIINIEKLQDYIDDLNKHSSECGGSIILSGERRDGLASILAGSCSACEKTIKLETSNKVKGPRGYCR